MKVTPPWREVGRANFGARQHGGQDEAPGALRLRRAHSGLRKKSAGGSRVTGVRVDRVFKPGHPQNFFKFLVDWSVNLRNTALSFDSNSSVRAANRTKAKDIMGRTSDAKEKLLDVAFQLIWDNSYGGVSVDQICERAKVNKGSFYYYFGSKADLAVAAYDEHWKQKQPELDRLFSAQLPPLERLSKWCDYIYEAQRQKSEKYGHVCGCPYSSIGVEVATQDDKIRLKVEELITRGTKYVESALADAIREGSVSISDPKTTAQQVYSYVLGTVLQAKIQNDVEVLRSIEPTVMAIIRAKSVVAA